MNRLLDNRDCEGCPCCQAAGPLRCPSVRIEASVDSELAGSDSVGFVTWRVMFISACTRR